MRPAGLLLLLATLAFAQSETFKEEAARNAEWSREAADAEQAAEAAEAAAKASRARYESRDKALDELKQLYVQNKDGLAREIVIARMEDLADAIERVERDATGARDRVLQAEARLARAAAATADWESDLEALIAAEPRTDWSALRTARAALVQRWIGAATRAVNARRDALANLADLREVLFRTRSTHQINNLTMRSPNEITWDSLQRSVRDLPALAAWIGNAALTIKDYFATEGGRSGVVRWSVSSLLAILVALVAAYLLRRFTLRSESAGEDTPHGRTLRGVARFGRRFLHLALIYFIPESATAILPGLSDPVIAYIDQIAVFFTVFYLVWAIYRELLRPTRPERALVKVEDWARRRISFAIHALLGTALVVRPLEVGLRTFEYGNPGAAALLEGVLLVVVALVLSGILFRRRLFEELLPKADTTWARIVCALARMLRPFLLLLMPAVAVLHLARYELLAAAVTRTSAAILGSVIATALLYQVAKALLLGWAHRQYGDDLESPETRGQATTAAGLFVLRFVFFLFAVWVMSALAGSSIEELRVTLDVPLPFQTGEDAPTYWRLFAAATVFFFFLFGTRHAKELLQYQVLERTSLDRSTQYTIATISGYVVLSVGIVMAVRMVFNLSDLGTIIAALSVGIGFGLQELVANFISGIVLLFERPIRVGDTIEVGTNRGLIRQINIRATTVQTRDNIFIMVPNRDLMTQTVVNYGYDDPRIRLRVPIGVSYASDPEQVKEVLLQVAADVDKVLRHPVPQVHFKGFGDSSLDFELLVWIQRPEQAPAITSTVNFAIFRALQEAGIEIPFPQRDLHIRSGLPPKIDAGPEPETRSEPEPEPEPGEDRED